MLLFASLPLYLLIIILDAVPSYASFGVFPRALKSVHRTTARHTHSLARDLRVAFGGVLAPRAAGPSSSSSSALINNHVVYCRPGKQGGGNGGNGGGVVQGNGTSSVTASGSGSTHSSSTSGTRTATVATPISTQTSSPWKLQQSHSGQTFFDDWDFFTLPDPTSGIVDFLNENDGRSNGLVDVNSQGNAIMRVETTPTVQGNRKSIRITTKQSYNGGLVILDAVHMPTGCGVWPAFWSNGPNWPNGGEIDIVEGVNDYINNQATIHTNVGCTLASSNSKALDISGDVIGGTDCAALTTGNQGCGIRATTPNTYGTGFNANGGGVYAMKWDTTGVAIWFFPRGSEPADITSEVPQPDSWGAAQANWPAASCDPFKFFNNHNAIFDTTLCGDWAGNVWTGTGIAGQEQSCAQRTGFSTCEAFVRASGSSFENAYWEVKSVKIYQNSN